MTVEKEAPIKNFTIKGLVEACRIAGKANEKVAIQLRGVMKPCNKDRDQEKVIYASACAEALVIGGVKHTKAEALALADKEGIRGYHALTQAWSRYIAVPKDPSVARDFRTVARETVQKLIDRLQKDEDGKLGVPNLPVAVAAFQAALKTL